MAEFKFIQNEPQVVKEYFKERGFKKTKPYFVAIGVYENNILEGIITIGKPSLPAFKFDFGIQNMNLNIPNVFEEAIRFFHSMYSGLIEHVDN